MSPLKVKKPEDQFVLPVEGEHLAKLESYVDEGEQEDRYNPGQMTHRVKLVWKLKGGSQQYQWCKLSLHPMSRLTEIATALLQAKPPDELDMDSLVGKQAILTLEHYDSEKGKRSKVTDIRPTAFKGRKLPEPFLPPPPETDQEADEGIPF